MKGLSICFTLLVVTFCRVAAQETLHPAKDGPNEESRTLAPLVNRNGWVNPEDLIPMPQCIAQQDQSTWLNTMTRCTRRQCTSHFGVICTHHQWLTQLSCLSTGFSPEVVRPYLAYCSRSVLAKAQLFRWVHTYTGRTWLVDIGDAYGLQNLSPASLAGGYAAVDVTDKAPMCLKNSASVSSMEPFRYVMASCGFTANTQHTGNAARPWEYSESLRSIIALDSETVGYDLTGRRIGYGDYFDKRCFCKAFRTDLETEPCSGSGLDLTKERLWLNATCGPTSLPDNWTDALKTTTYAYIPTENWRWPACVPAMPKKVTRLTDQCATDACELDSSGYCKVKRAVDRACFCRNISYDTCKGSCQIFETRIDYVNWLHELCGSEQGWHGLPKHWRQLAALTPLDMVPWRWSIKPSKDSSPVTTNHSKSSKSSKSAQTCASTEWKLGSLILINIATLLAGLFGPKTGPSLIARSCLRYSHSRSWFLTGLTIATLHLCANGINAVLIQSTLGYDSIPIIQMVLLWCSMPRFTWLTVALVGAQPFKATTFSTAASCLFAESILQVLSAYPMITTVSYGREHGFYNQGMARLEPSLSAQFLYAGALMWLVVMVVTLVLLIQALRETLIARFNACQNLFEENLTCYWEDKFRHPEGPSSTIGQEFIYTDYGTLPVKRPVTKPNNRIAEKKKVRLSLITIISTTLLCIAQWLFWAGFIGLSMEEFCPPKLGLLTLVWIASSVAVATVAVLP